MHRRRDRHQYPYFKYTSPRHWMERPRLGPLHAPATVLAIATALAAAGLCSLDRDKQIAFDLHAVLPLLVVELLTLQRLVSRNQHAHADRIGPLFICWSMLFTVTQSDTVFTVSLRRRPSPSARVTGSTAASVAEIIALVLSRSLGLAGDPAREAFVATAYILVVSTPLLVTTRISAFARTQWTRQALPKPSACEEIAVRYGLTAREKEILTILAEGHRQALARNRRLDERVHDVAAPAG